MTFLLSPLRWYCQYARISFQLSFKKTSNVLFNLIPSVVYFFKRFVEHSYLNMHRLSNFE